MGISIICDNCGKNDTHTGTIFTNEPFSLVRNTYDGKKIKIALNIIGFEESVVKKCQDIANGNVNLEEAIVFQPTPVCLCQACKKSLIYDLLKNGTISKDGVVGTPIF